MPSESSCPFLSLPLELRESIYSLYLKPADRLVRNDVLDAQGYFGGVYKFDFNLFRVNKQIYTEAKGVWKRENVFVKIATPWPSAGMYRIYLMATDGGDMADYGPGGTVNHISSEGLVPIVCIDQQADQFASHHALVQITAPFHQAVPEHSVVVLLDDLHLFTQTWYYSALSYPMLNDRLSTTFALRDPNIGSTTAEQKQVSISLQRRLLLPFQQVKGLYHMEVLGYAAEVKAELEKKMAMPIPTLRECCESALDFMERGDQALIYSTPQEALKLYTQAFQAIHILIHGRTRRVLADVFFHEGIEHGRFAGQSGMTVRVVLRLKLVSRCVLAYLKLEQWDDAAFWGMRTIRIMRESMDVESEDFLSEFIGGEDVGMIYVRTGLAFWKMEADMQKWEDELNSYSGDELVGSTKILAVAARYMKSRVKATVRKELNEYGVSRDVVDMFADEQAKNEELSTMGQDGSSEE